MSFAIGSLIKARGREWVVLPESQEDLLVVRPLGGTEDEVTGIYVPLETVEPATFALPDPSRPGDHRSCRLLRDAVRLGFRSSAGPFRSLGHIAVEPRPYQLVPLLMALKLDPVRMLIADDVGIGKTVEAGLIARELIDRGEAGRMAVLCPPHLAEQWQAELRDKFHIEAELVLPGTAARLERHCRIGQSLFEIYPFTVVSLDFIKSERRRHDFLRACPELVIVDEAHTCAASQERSGSRHQRHQLLSGLSADPSRHLVLTTATPHSGDEGAFRSLLALLNPEFAALPDDLAGQANQPLRRRLARHFVQRRRGDIQHYLDADTPFPEREEREVTYRLSPDYRRLFERALRYCRERVQEGGGSRGFRQRVRWWSALALLRSLASSPAAAAATMRNRAATADATSEAEADVLGRRTILDQVDDDTAEATDVSPGSETEEENEGETQRHQRRLRDMAREADALLGAKDLKLQGAIKQVKELLEDGFSPIVFCRYIPTAEYVSAELRKKLPKGVEVAAVTGLLAPAEREARVLELGQSERRVLVATDCLSEGINLQAYFDAVFHYDLSWNPTRHEQREGRVDRYNQPSPKVRVATYWGTDNQVDGIVLDVLLRKHKTIRNALGISVPVPVDTEQVVEALFEGLLLREHAGASTSGAQLSFEQLDQDWSTLLRPQKEKLHSDWETAAAREKRSRTIFAQETIDVREVAREIGLARGAVGAAQDVASFVFDALKAYGGAVRPGQSVQLDVREAPSGLRDAIGIEDELSGRFELPVRPGETYLSRTHPIIEGLANFITETALDPLGQGPARRCGVIRTRAVERRTTLLLVRFRFHIETRVAGKSGTQVSTQLAEECGLLAFSGSPQSAQWLPEERAEALLTAEPDGNISPDLAAHHLRQIIDNFSLIAPRFSEAADERSRKLLEDHQRVREAARSKGVSYRVEPQLPADILGVYIYLPAAAVA